MPFCILRCMRVSEMVKSALVAGAAAALALAGTTARAADVLAAPRVIAEQRSIPGLFVTATILDMRGVQENPVMRARRDYSLMTALPVVQETKLAPVPFVSETQKWKLSRTVLLTFPLAITSRNFVTAEIAGAGQLAVMPTGLAQGGVFTFTGAF